MKKELIVGWLTAYEQLLVYPAGINISYLVTIPEIHFYSHKNELCELCLLGKLLLGKRNFTGHNDAIIKLVSKKIKRFLEQIFFSHSNNKDVLICIARFYFSLGPTSYNNTYYILSKILNSKCNFFEHLSVKGLQ